MTDTGCNKPVGFAVREFSATVIHFAERRKTRPGEKGARSAAQAGRLPDARSVWSRHLRWQSARSAEARRLVFYAVESRAGRYQNAGLARCSLGFRDAHGPKRAGVASARGQTHQGISAALQYLVPRRQALPRRESRSDRGMAAISVGAFQERRRRALLRPVRPRRRAPANAQFHAKKIWRPDIRTWFADGARIEIGDLSGADAVERD